MMEVTSSWAGLGWHSRAGGLWRMLLGCGADGVLGIPSSMKYLRAAHPLLLSTFPAMTGPYPAIQGGGSLILAWQVRNKRILVVGGGEVSIPCLRDRA